jgi:hydrogenase nickel incorporation protein HypB
VSQINTGKGCHLDANQVRTGMANLPLGELDLLIIENVGNLICPVGFDLGQDVKVGMFSVPEGDDKPAKHPYVVLEAGLLLLNKVDLLPYVPFDIERFGRDIASIREHVPTMRISATTGEGVDAWTQWLRSLATTAHEPAAVDAR